MAALRVVVDTNILVSSPRLSSSAWRAFLSAGRQGVVGIFVPEVCLIEAEGWVRREGSLRSEEMTRSIQRLEQIGVRIAQWGVEDQTQRLTADAVSGYRRYLEERLQGAATVLPIPDVSHEFLVRRAVERVRPFNEKGTGYRDALIWESVCELAAKAPVTQVADVLEDDRPERIVVHTTLCEARSAFPAALARRRPRAGRGLRS